MATLAKKLMSQLNNLNSSPLEDIALLPSDSPFEVNAIIFGPADTPYFSGAFKIRLKYGPDYPAAPPSGTFFTRIYHPNVSLKGEICVNTLKRDWQPDVTVSHILMVIKCLLISPGPDSALNEDAGRQLLDSYEEFAKTARMWTSVHALKVDKAMAELTPEGRVQLKVSYMPQVLSDSDVNKGQIHTLDAEVNVAKKLKSGDGKKKADGKKKTLRRL